MAADNPIRSILVVDNNPALVAFLEEILTNENYHVRTASTGTQALRLIEEHIPDLAIIDRIMPEIDGDELCRILRSDAHTRSIFLVMLSAIAAEDPERPAGMLVDAYLAKLPFRELKAAMLEIISDFAAGNLSKYADRVIGIDTLNRREITAELLESRKHLEAFFETTPNGVVELNPEHIIIRANSLAAQMLGVEDGRLVSRDFLSIFAGVVSERTLRTFISSAGTDQRRLGETEPVMMNDRALTLTARPVHSRLGPSVLVMIEDVSRLQASHLETQQLLEENQRLLREVQHRIKNNLSTISSMLYLAASRTESAEAREVLSASESKVRTVLRVHETLNATGQYEHVEFTGFLRTLCSDTQSLYSSSRHHISSRIPDERILLPAGTASPLGLMVNELITNACKHAIPVDHEAVAEAHVQLDRPSETQLRIQVSDNGPGLPGGTLENTSMGLGLQILAAQAEQIGAQLHAHSSDAGTRFEILLPYQGN